MSSYNLALTAIRESDAEVQEFHKSLADANKAVYIARLDKEQKKHEQEQANADKDAADALALADEEAAAKAAQDVLDV